MESLILPQGSLTMLLFNGLRTCRTDQDIMFVSLAILMIFYDSSIRRMVLPNFSTILS